MSELAGAERQRDKQQGLRVYVLGWIGTKVEHFGYPPLRRKPQIICPRGERDTAVLRFWGIPLHSLHVAINGSRVHPGRTKTRGLASGLACLTVLREHYLYT